MWPPSATIVVFPGTQHERSDRLHQLQPSGRGLERPTRPPVADRTAGLAQAAEPLDRAVDGLRRAATEEFISRGLLARAALRRFDFAGATEDLTEALEIAERGPMRLYECDAHLEWARLCRDQGDLAAARRHVARARELVNETGYGRREREVRWLEGTVGS